MISKQVALVVQNDSYLHSKTIFFLHLIKMEHKKSKQSVKREHLKNSFKDIAIVACSVLLLSLAVWQNLEVKKQFLSEINKLNVTSNCNNSLLIFNRVPKVREQQLVLWLLQGKPSFRSDSFLS